MTLFVFSRAKKLFHQLARGGTGGGTLNYTAYTGTQLNTVTGYSPRTYLYDPNGNATSDGNTKAIQYNLLNLPQTVTQSGTTLATYTYDATGQKLRNSGSDGNWDYIGGIVYHNNTIAFIQTEEGRIANNSGSYNYEYNLKDHLGNNRVSIDAYNNTARVIQEDEYYSFGLRKPTGGYDLSNNNRYLYNGKERQTDLANQYDYGARFYDPVVARWNTIDPLAEQDGRWTPYGYGFDNSIRFEDPDGMWPDDGGGDDLGLGGRIVATLAFDFKHAVFNTFNRAIGSPYRETYKTVNGQEVFESQIYKEQPATNLKQAGIQVIGAVADAAAVIPEVGSVGKLAAKTATEATVGKELTGTVSLENQAKEISETLNGGKNSVTIGTTDKQIRYDLVGKEHAGVPTPHYQVYNKNMVNREMKSISRANKSAVKMSQADIRAIRKFLKKLK